MENGKPNRMNQSRKRYLRHFILSLIMGHLSFCTDHLPFCIFHWSEFFDHGDFVAVWKLDTSQAFRPDLMGKHRLVHDLETELFEELRLV